MMSRWTLLISFSSFIILYYSAVTSAQDNELTSWSPWTCFNSTIASRNRTVQNCTDVEYIDPVTNMTMTNTSCDNVTEIDRRTDVVSANTWSNWAPMAQCGNTSTITQSRTSSCQTADFVCSSICTGGRTTQRTTTIPLCCAQQNYSEWTTWAPGCSPSDPVPQTRQRVVLPCDQNIQCEPDCPDRTEMRIIAQTSWGMWGLWSSMEVPMCGAGVRSRQRVCTNTTLVYCDIDCTFGTNDTDNQCCVVSNVWSTWSSWSQATNNGPCPDTRTRTRSCVADTSVTGMYPGQPNCDGTCTLNTEQPERQGILTSRCVTPSTIITELTPWSQWACFNDTIASRNRIVQRCADVEDIDPVTNMTMINTICDNLTDVDRRTDVVSANTWTNWAPMAQCGSTGTITQSRTSSCQTVDFECSSICTGGRTTQRTTTIPLCCTQQNYSEWTTWAPGCSPSDPVPQTRQRVVLPCDQSIQCEPDCPDRTEMRIIAQTSWGMWGLWSLMEVPMCGAGVRSRQRVCTNTTLVYCDIDCTFGTNDTDNQCCVVSSVWSTWSSWSQATNSGPCPDTRTRTRSCEADTSVTGMYPGQPDCDGTCTVNTEQPERQEVDTPRCAGFANPADDEPLPTSTSDEGFPTWAIGLISAIGVILVVAGFVAITIGGRYLTRRRQYSIGEATAAADKQYEKMNEGVPHSAYQPTTSFTEGIPGTTATDSINFIEPFEEKQL